MQCIGLELYAKTKKQGAMYLLIFGPILILCVEEDVLKRILLDLLLMMGQKLRVFQRKRHLKMS